MSDLSVEHPARPRRLSVPRGAGTLLLVLLLSHCVGSERGLPPECACPASDRADEADLSACPRAWSRLGTRASRILRETLASEGGLAQVRCACDRLRGASGEGRCRLELGRALYTDERDAAEAAFRRALSLAAATGDLTLENEVHGWWRWNAINASDYAAALEHANACVQLTHEHSGSFSNHDRSVAIEAVAGLLQDFDDLPRARRALELAYAHDDTVASQERDAQKRRLLILTSNQYLAEERYELAYQATREWLDHEAPQPDSPDTRAARFNHMVACLHTASKPGRLEEARAALDQVRERAAAAPPGPLGYHEAIFANSTGQPKEAEAAARRALAAEGEGEGADSAFAAGVEYQLGLALESLGQLDDAARAYADALARAEALVASSGLGDLKEWLSSTKRDPLEALFALQARRGDALGAVETLERARAADFLNAFDEATRADQPGSGALELVVRGNRRVEALGAVFKLLPRQGAMAGGRRLEPAALLRRVGPAPALAYFAARDKAFLVRVTGGRPTLIELLHPERLKALAERFAGHPDDMELAEQLGAALLPEGALPKPGGSLRIVADRALGLERIAWAALRRHGRYLAQDHSVLAAPSLHALAAQGRGASSRGPALVLGDPRGDLPEARAEAQEVAAALGVEANTGAHAGWQALKGAADPGVLHLATHARSDVRGDVLVLADVELSAVEVLRAGLRARVVVLASCHSGVAGRGSLSGSLAQAFLASGSGTVLASLTSVEDDVTRRFVRDFYAHGGANDPRRALASVQRERIAASEPVGTWAPFALFGVGP